MELMREFLNEELYQKHYAVLFDDDDLNLVRDYSDFIVVDGEEGDHGEIKYYKDGELFATHIIHGGDIEEVEYTLYGRRILIDKLIKTLG